MGLQINFLICTIVVFLTLYIGIAHAFRLRRRKGIDLREIMRRTDIIIEAMKKLPHIQGKERLTACRTIAEEMRFQSIALVEIVWGSLCHSDQKSEIGKLTVAALQEARELNWQLYWFLLQLRFSPSRVKDCRHRIQRAVEQHLRMWEALLRLWRVQYPDQFKDLPDLSAL